VRAGDGEAVSEALNLIDDRRPERRARALDLLTDLEGDARARGVPRLGLTGAPGAGKSTLLDALLRRLRARGERIGVIAVDPSSRRSGGALLGDRVRLRSGARDPGVFVRSMAARERLGGLAEATRAGVVVLAAAFDRVIVETVGVGQSESEVASLADTLVYVAQPGAGDLLQFMKAGLLELPDVFVVNKADLGPVAERTASELEAGIGLGERDASGWSAPVVRVSARDGAGVDALVEVLDAHRAFLEAEGRLQARRRRGRDAHVRETLRERYGSFGLETLGGEEPVRLRLAAEPDAAGFGLVQRLGREIEEALAKPLAKRSGRAAAAEGAA
jgi:LAO/AO transport system kinase